MKPLPLLILSGLIAFTPAFAETAPEKDKPSTKTENPVPGAKLVVGDKAPTFVPTAWIQGEPVKEFEKGKVYLIECWATWCGPCLASIPHLNELHKKFADKGLVVIGVNVKDKTDPAPIAEFVKAKGDAMSYRIAFDEVKSHPFGRDWLDAAGARGIPHAFVVRDGILIWQGHPGMLHESTIPQMLDGTFDWKAADARRITMEAKEKKKAEDSMAKFNAMFAEEKAGHFDEALKLAEEGAKTSTGRDRFTMRLQQCRILAKKGDMDAAMALAKKLGEEEPSNTGLQLSLGNFVLVNDVFKGNKAAAAVANECAKRILADPQVKRNPMIDIFIAKAARAAGETPPAP